MKWDVATNSGNFIKNLLKDSCVKNSIFGITFPNESNNKCDIFNDGTLSLRKLMIQYLLFFVVFEIRFYAWDYRAKTSLTLTSVIWTTFATLDTNDVIPCLRFLRAENEMIRTAVFKHPYYKMNRIIINYRWDERTRLTRMGQFVHHWNIEGAIPSSVALPSAFQIVGRTPRGREAPSRGRIWPWGTCVFTFIVHL